MTRRCKIMTCEKASTPIISKHNAWIVIISLHLLVVFFFLRIPDLSTHLLRSTATSTTAAHSRSSDTIDIGDEEEVGNIGDDPGQYRILMIHYHKTGFVLSRELRSLAEQNLLRFETFNSTHDKKNSTIFHIPEKNWGSIQQPRKFNQSTKCIDLFHLEGGYINVQESPDLFCSVEKLADVLLNEDDVKTTRETRIIHFVRDPYSMALSNYFYHVQDPTPEPWVTTHDPCELQYVNSKLTLKHLLFPTLSDSGIMKRKDFDRISKLCRSLYQTELKTQAYEGHLQQLDPVDGLRLSTSQMMIRGGGEILVPGGDLLRMVNTMIKLRELQRYLDNRGGKFHRVTVVTVSMDDFISDPEAFTAKYLNFLLGNNGHLICPGMNCQPKIKMIAKSFGKKYATMKESGSSHVTTGTHTEKNWMKNVLKIDPNFGPILDRIESLVNEELHKSNDPVRSVTKKYIKNRTD